MGESLSFEVSERGDLLALPTDVYTMGSDGDTEGGEHTLRRTCENIIDVAIFIIIMVQQTTIPRF